MTNCALKHTKFGKGEVKMVAQALKRLRENSGYTQQQIANALSVERSTYTYYETGKTTPDIKTLSKLAKIFNVTLAELLESEERARIQHLQDFDGDLYCELDPKNTDHIYELTKKEKAVVSLYRALPDEAQKEVLDSLKKEVDSASKKRNKTNKETF